MKDIVPKEHLDLAYQTIAVLATYKKAEDLINIGAYVKGSNPEIDKALSLIGELKNFLRQPVEERYSLEESITLLKEVFNKK